MANEVVITVKADDKASGKISTIGNTLKRGLAVGAVAAGAAVVGVGVSAIKMAADFDKAFGEVTTLFDGTEDQVKSLRSGVKDMAREMGVDATTAAQALYQAISAGVPPDNAIEFLRENTRFAVAGVTDLTTAVDTTTTVLNAWGLQASDLTRVQDVLFSGVRAGKTTVDELGASLFQVAPVAAAAGVDIENVTAALATLTAAGVPTSVAATNLRQAFVELGKDGTKASKIFKETAGVSFRDFIAAGNDVDSVMVQLNKASNELGVSVGDLFGSVEAGNAATILAGEGWQGFTDNLDSARAASGLTDEAFDKMNGTFDRQFQILQGQLKGVLLDIGEAVLPHLISMLERLNPWLQEHIPQAIEWMREKWIELQPHIEAFQRYLSEEVIPTIQEIIELVREYWPEISAIIRFVMEDVRLNLERTLGTIIDIFQLFNAILHGDWSRAWAEIKSIVQRQIDFVKGMLDNRLRLIRDLFGDQLRAIRDTVAYGFGVVVNWFTDLPGRLLHALRALPDQLRNLFIRVGKAIIQGIIDGMNALKHLIPNPLSWIPGGAGIGSAIGAGLGILGFQHGGIVTQPTLAVVGEAGPEAVIPIDRLREMIAQMVEDIEVLRGQERGAVRANQLPTTVAYAEQIQRMLPELERLRQTLALVERQQERYAGFRAEGEVRRNLEEIAFHRNQRWALFRNERQAQREEWYEEYRRQKMEERGQEPETEGGWLSGLRQTIYIDRLTVEGDPAEALRSLGVQAARMG